LTEKVGHRTVVLPKLGAYGILVKAVKERSGFAVKYGQIRAKDLPEYLDTGECTEYM